TMPEAMYGGPAEFFEIGYGFPKRTDMEVRHIQAFIAVAEELSLRRAGRRLGVSQASISRQVQQLEQELGLTLFLRRRDGIELTHQGTLMLDQAMRLASHPLAGRSSIRLSDLAQDRLLLHDRDHAPIIYDKIFELYAAAGVTPHIVATTASPASPGGLINVASGKGIYLGLGSLMTMKDAPGIAVV